MIAIDAPCEICGFVFYGFAYVGEVCSEECWIERSHRLNKAVAP